MRGGLSDEEEERTKQSWKNKRQIFTVYTKMQATKVDLYKWRKANIFILVKFQCIQNSKE